MARKTKAKNLRKKINKSRKNTKIGCIKKGGDGDTDTYKLCQAIKLYAPESVKGTMLYLIGCTTDTTEPIEQLQEPPKQNQVEYDSGISDDSQSISESSKLVPKYCKLSNETYFFPEHGEVKTNTISCNKNSDCEEHVKEIIIKRNPLLTSELVDKRYERLRTEKGREIDVCIPKSPNQNHKTPNHKTPLRECRKFSGKDRKLWEKDFNKNNCCNYLTKDPIDRKIKDDFGCPKEGHYENKNIEKQILRSKNGYP